MQHHAAHVDRSDEHRDVGAELLRLLNAERQVLAVNDALLAALEPADGQWRYFVTVNLETGETIDLTPFENTTGRFISASYRHPDEFLLGINNRDPRWHDVWRVDVTSGERELVLQNERTWQDERAVYEGIDAIWQAMRACSTSMPLPSGSRMSTRHSA